jgi:hypothetical protein
MASAGVVPTQSVPPLFGRHQPDREQAAGGAGERFVLLAAILLVLKISARRRPGPAGTEYTDGRFHSKDTDASGTPDSLNRFRCRGSDTACRWKATTMVSAARHGGRGWAAGVLAWVGTTAPWSPEGPDGIATADFPGGSTVFLRRMRRRMPGAVAVCDGGLNPYVLP